MPAVLPIPPTGTPVFDRQGLMTEAWRRYWLSIDDAVATGAAPSDAQYYVATASTDLTNERNLGALTTGFLFLTVGAGVAVPSSTLNGASLTNLNATELASGLVGLARGGVNADLSATGGTSQVLQQVSPGAAITVGPLTTTDIAGLASGTYTPTLTNAANITASTAFTCQYLRVGDVVTVSGQVAIDPTSATTNTTLGISLPIASNFSATEQCGGAAACGAVAGYSASIAADATNDTASLFFVTGTDVANRNWFFTFTYQVL